MPVHSIHAVLSAGCTAPNMKTQVFKILTLLRTETEAPLGFKGLFFWSWMLSRRPMQLLQKEKKTEKERKFYI